jgi:hypothetical protein
MLFAEVIAALARLPGTGLLTVLSWLSRSEPARSLSDEDDEDAVDCADI